MTHQSKFLVWATCAALLYLLNSQQHPSSQEWTYFTNLENTVVHKDTFLYELYRLHINLIDSSCGWYDYSFFHPNSLFDEEEEQVVLLQRTMAEICFLNQPSTWKKCYCPNRKVAKTIKSSVVILFVSGRVVFWLNSQLLIFIHEIWGTRHTLWLSRLRHWLSRLCHCGYKNHEQLHIDTSKQDRLIHYFVPKKILYRSLQYNCLIFPKEINEMCLSCLICQVHWKVWEGCMERIHRCLLLLWLFLNWQHLATQTTHDGNDSRWQYTEWTGMHQDPKHIDIEDCILTSCYWQDSHWTYLTCFIGINNSSQVN